MEYIKIVNKNNSKDIRTVDKKLFDKSFHLNFDICEEKMKESDKEDELNNTIENRKTNIKDITDSLLSKEGWKEAFIVQWKKRTKKDILELFESLWKEVLEEDKELNKRQLLEKYI